MQTVTAALERANTIYYTSTDRAELAGAAAELEGLLAQGWLNARNRENAEALLWRVRAKELALAYFSEGYNEDDYAALSAFCAEKQPAAEERGYGNTAQLLARLSALAAAVHVIMQDAAAAAERVRTYGGQPATSSAEECAEVAALFAAKEEAAASLTEEAPFGSVAFPDVKAELAEELAKVRAFAQKLGEEIRLKDVASFRKDHAEPVGGEYAAFEFYPARSEEERTAGAVVLCTPFFDEAVLFAVKNTEGTVYRVAVSAFAGRGEEEIGKIFALFAKEGADLLIEGLPAYRGDRAPVLAAAMRFGRGGRRAFLLDGGSRALYGEALKAASAAGLPAADISFTYLSVPLYEETADLLEERGMIGAEEREEVRRTMPFMGFVGLNLAVRAFVQKKDWRSVAAAHSAANAPLAAAYLAQLPSQGLLIDGGWGNFAEDVTDDTRRSFDYDDIRTADQNNIRKIAEGGYTVFEQCGAIVRYCTLAGADSSVWETLSPAEKSERLSEATRLILRALGVQTETDVQVLDELPVKGAGGLCCDGGKSILYRSDCVKNYEWTIDAVCHECYHAFQHMVMYGPWREWYWTDLGVTRGRKAEWLVNTGKKYFPNVGSPSYYVQVRESEARAFAKDCLRDADKIWNSLNFD